MLSVKNRWNRCEKWSLTPFPRPKCKVSSSSKGLVYHVYLLKLSFNVSSNNNKSNHRYLWIHVKKYQLWSKLWQFRTTKFRKTPLTVHFWCLCVYTGIKNNISNSFGVNLFDLIEQNWCIVWNTYDNIIYGFELFFSTGIDDQEWYKMA